MKIKMELEIEKFKKQLEKENKKKVENFRRAKLKERNEKIKENKDELSALHEELNKMTLIYNEEIVKLDTKIKSIIKENTILIESLKKEIKNSPDIKSDLIFFLEEMSYGGVEKKNWLK